MGIKRIDIYDIVIQVRENFAKVKEEYKTIEEYENFIRETNPCIKEKDEVRIFALIDGMEIVIREF